MQVGTQIFIAAKALGVAFVTVSKDPSVNVIKIISLKCHDFKML
jgi:hypothetical protein